ncbi:unnamed protein product, partial [marine sediment metagenome]
ESRCASILLRDNFSARSTKGIYYRPDLKFLEILDHFRNALGKAGFTVDPQIFVVGGSNGGVWTNRFALLYPTLVKAAAPSATGMLTMPLESYDQTPMPYPMGIGDLSQLGLPPFDLENFKKIRFFTIIGEQDTHDPFLNCPPGSSRYDFDWEQIVFFKEAFGETAQERVEAFHEQLVALGMDSTFRIYPAAGHIWTREMMRDMIDFFQ